MPDAPRNAPHLAHPHPPHPLLRLLLDAADGHFPPVDGTVAVVPALGRGLEVATAFTGHAVIATGLPDAEVQAQGPDGFGGSMAPDFLRWIAGPRGWVGSIDNVLVARGTGGSPQLPLLDQRSDLADVHRVRYAREVRDDVRVHGDKRGLVILASGVAGRRELSIEAAPEGHGRGWGRSLLADALTLVPAGEPVFAAVAPGNARSLRAFLATAFVPIGSEVLIRPQRP
ncbi:hypothetical protein ACEZCY_09370 [Streptacidiphilus sp. N1-12]|uniref:Uncharacterized protein n=2 Tax=Streptacidiphilus alkalitolerans TaxID=3342712 RepID=A0ABV6VHL5_9ACTN